MDKIYDNEFNVSINIIEIIDTLNEKSELNLIEFLFGRCDIEKKLTIISDAISDYMSMEDNLALAKEVIGWLDSAKRQEIIDYTNKLLEKRDKYSKKLSKQ